MAVQTVTPFFKVILSIYLVSVSSINSVSQRPLSGTVACKTYNTSKMDCSHRNLVDIPILDKNLTTVLDLSHNQLKDIHGAPFENLTDLLKLNLSYNEISSLNSTTFKGLSRLQELDLCYNGHLKALPQDIFSDRCKLLYLNMKATLLYDIPSQTLATLYSLQYLYLSYLGNAFDILMQDLYNLTKLEDLLIVVLNANVTNVTVQPLAGLPIQNLIFFWLPFSVNHWMETTAFAPFTTCTVY